MNAQATSELATVAQASQELGVSESTVWRLIRRGTLASVRKNGRRLIPREALSARAQREQESEFPPFTEDNPIFRLIGAGRGGGKTPGARDKHAILDS